jgi:hypothetical protein
MRKIRTTMTALGVAAAVMVMSTGTAFAAGTEYDIYGGRGGATWDWFSRYEIRNLRTVAWDRMCNAEGIYAYVIVHDFQGTRKIGGVEDSGGCNGGHQERNGMSWYNSRARIEGITIRLCRDTNWSDECVGAYIANPWP